MWCGWKTEASRQSPPAEQQMACPAQTEFVICDCTIELLFKLWKQYAQTDVSRSKKPWHLLCDFYAKLIGMMIVHWMMIVGCWQVPSRSMVKATKAIRHQINLVARALAGRDDLIQVLHEITQGLDRCRIDKRKKRPNTFQLLLDPTLQQTDLLVSRGAGGP